MKKYLLKSIALLLLAGLGVSCMTSGLPMQAEQPDAPEKTAEVKKSGSETESESPVAQSAAQELFDPGYDVSPVIILPGISHSELYLYDENEPDGIKNDADGGNIIDGILPVDMMGALKPLLGKAVAAIGSVLITQRTNQFFKDTLKAVADSLFGQIKTDETGKLINEDYRLVRFDRRRAEFQTWHKENPDTPAKEFESKLSEREQRLPTSYAEMFPGDVDYLRRMVTTSYASAGLGDGFEERMGQDKIFFFTFNLYSDPLSAAADLEQFIQDVKEITGHKKVSLLNVSLGGTIFTAWADIYGKQNNFKDLDRVVNAVAVLQGMTIISEFYAAAAFNAAERTGPRQPNPHFNLSDEYLYADFVGKIFGNTASENVTARVLNALLRILPREAVENVLSALFDSFYSNLLQNTPQAWAMVNSDTYQKISGVLLKDLPIIKEKTERFCQAQLNLESNVKAMSKAGVAVSSICGYNVNFGDIDYKYFSVAASTGKINSDGVIDTKSTSMGATCVAPGQTLGYTSTKLDTGNHSYVSPDGALDASTCALPKTTWFFDGMLHEDANSNSAATNLISTLLSSPEPFTVLDYPDVYPQFGKSANNKMYRRGAIGNAQRVLDENDALTPEEIAALEHAILRAQAEIGTTICDQEEVEAIKREFIDVLAQYYPDSGDYQTESDFMKSLEKVFVYLDEKLFDVVGGQGYSDYVKGWFK